MGKVITPEQRKAFGERLTRDHITLMQRLNRFIDQGELAEELEIERSLIGKYLNGQAVPGDGKLVKLANFFEDEGLYDALGYERPAIQPERALDFVRHRLAHTDDVYFEYFVKAVEEAKAERQRQAEPPP